MTSTQPRIGDELDAEATYRPLQESGRNSSQSEQRARTCVRRLAYRPTEACPRSSGRERAQLLRHRTDPSLRDHLPPRGPRLLGRGATVAGFIVAATHHHLQAFQGLYLFDAVTFVVFALVVLVWIPDPGLADAPSASEDAQGFRAVARDRLLLALIAGNLALVMIGGAFFSNILPPFAVAHTPVGAGEIGVVVFINTFFIVVAQLPATRLVARMRRTHALFATSAIFAVGLLAVLLATLTHSTLAATTVLAGVAIVIAVAECGQFIVLGPLVAEIAPPHLLGRYMSLYQLSFMVRVALGPAVGGLLPGTSPDTIWWGGAFALALTGAGFLRLGNRIPDPLLPTKSPPLQAASEAT